MSAALADKVVVVTGSTRGIGRAIVEGCAAEGAVVIVSSRSEDAVVATVHELTARGVRSSGMVCDVRSYDDLEALFEHALATWGGVDIWVNNAGVSEGYRPVDELAPTEITEVVDINLTGTMLGCRLLVPYLREHGGVLLNMAGRGYRGEATPHTAAYAATKAAVASLTRSIAAENKDRPDVHVHALVPGMVATDFYRNVKTSPRLEASSGNVDLALNAFGVALDDVGRETATFLGGRAWHGTGRIVNLLRGARLARGIALMAWYGVSGRTKRDL
jgi:glucose 1-dehydrogenase